MKKFLCWLCAIILWPVSAMAQMAVVRVDGNRVYLDISEEKTPPVPGNTFQVILSAEPLTNPQTGKNLGEIYHYSAPGTITEVQPLYAVGELDTPQQVTVGKQAVWVNTQTAAPAPAPAVPAVEPATPSRPYTTYAPIAQTVISLTEAAVTAPGANNIITLSNNNDITVFSRTAGASLTPELSFSLPAGKKGLAVSAVPVQEGLAQIFVPVLTEARGTITTLILENKNGQLVQTATLPFYVKELGCGTDKKVWAQRPFVLGLNPGNAREIIAENNKFTTGKTNFNTKHHWLAGLNYYPVETSGKDNLLTTASNGVLRLTLGNGKTAESKDIFGSTPLRMQYKQQILKFYPSVQVFGTPGQATMAAVENGTKLGLLSETFGQYQAGKIHFLQYVNGTLTITATVELAGVLYDTACTDNAVLTAEALPDGSSRIVEISK